MLAGVGVLIQPLNLRTSSLLLTSGRRRKRLSSTLANAAQAFGGTLYGLHVAGNIAANAVGVEGYTTDFIALQREVEESARKQLDGLLIEADRRTLSTKTIALTSNSPAQSIVSYAKDAHIDLVVVGTHGRGGMAHMLMGSVAERVVRTAPCPVLTVRCPAFDSTSQRQARSQLTSRREDRTRGTSHS